MIMHLDSAAGHFDWSVSDVARLEVRWQIRDWVRVVRVYCTCSRNEPVLSVPQAVRTIEIKLKNKQFYSRKDAKTAVKRFGCFSVLLWPNKTTLFQLYKLTLIRRGWGPVGHEWGQEIWTHGHLRSVDLESWLHPARRRQCFQFRGRKIYNDEHYKLMHQTTQRHTRIHADG